MKLEPKKIFVLQDGKYIELSYQEFQKIDAEGKFTGIQLFRDGHIFLWTLYLIRCFWLNA